MIDDFSSYHHEPEIQRIKSGIIGNGPKSSSKYYKGSINDRMIDDFSSYNGTQINKMRTMEGDLSSIINQSESGARLKGIIDDFSSVSTNQ